MGYSVFPAAGASSGFSGTTPISKHIASSTSSVGIPSTVNMVYAVLFGAGGGSGGNNYYNGNLGGNGGGGGISFGYTPASNVAVIGAAGAAGAITFNGANATYNNNSGGSGGQTVYSTLFANGGNGGVAPGSNINGASGNNGTANGTSISTRASASAISIEGYNGNTGAGTTTPATAGQSGAVILYY